MGLMDWADGMGCLLNENNETMVAIECLVIKLGIQELKADIPAKVGKLTIIQDLFKITD